MVSGSTDFVVGEFKSGTFQWNQRLRLIRKVDTETPELLHWFTSYDNICCFNRGSEGGEREGGEGGGEGGVRGGGEEVLTQCS